MKHIIIILLLIFCGAGEVLYPAGRVVAPPLPPVLRNVTVNNENGTATITWNPSPSPGITGYVVYRYRNNEGYAIDTIRNPSILTFTDYSTGALFFSESYVVAAIDDEENISPLSNSLSTIFLTGITDTCNLKVTFDWNRFIPSGTEVTGYEIKVAEGEGDFVTIHTNTPPENIFYWQDFDFHQVYHIYVKALMADGSSSESNIVSIDTDLPRPPEWIDISLVTVNENVSVVLSVEYDPLAEINRFNIVRKSKGDDSFTLLDDVISTGGSFSYTDHSANPTEKYVYRVDAVNSCGIAAISSTLANNIVLENKIGNSMITLTWNAYPGWEDAFHGYTIYKNTDGSFREMIGLAPADTIYTTDYRNLMYEIRGGEVCFMVKAVRYGVDPGDYEAFSNISCFKAFEEVYVPTAFTPDDDGLNDYFRPVMPFTPSTYYLVIRERNGRLVFSSSDFNESWDGTFTGRKLPPDVYLWHLRLQTPSGTVIEKRGSVAIIYNN